VEGSSRAKTNSIHSSVSIRFDRTPTCDRQTDRQTDTGTGPQLVPALALRRAGKHVDLSVVVLQVFSALRAGQLHIPYRNSKLTHILQPSLGGDAKVPFSFVFFTKLPAGWLGS